MSEELDVPPVSTGVMESLLASRDALGKNALDAWNAKSARQKEVRTQRANRRAFCELRGINLDKATAFYQQPAVPIEPATAVAPPPVIPESLGKEGQFIVKIANSKPAEGFTMEELPGIAEEHGIIDATDKNARQPLFNSVIALEKQGILKKADFTRDSKVVYISNS